MCGCEPGKGPPWSQAGRPMGSTQEAPSGFQRCIWVLPMNRCCLHPGQTLVRPSAGIRHSWSWQHPGGLVPAVRTLQGRPPTSSPPSCWRLEVQEGSKAGGGEVPSIKKTSKYTRLGPRPNQFSGKKGLVQFLTEVSHTWEEPPTVSRVVISASPPPNQTSSASKGLPPCFPCPPCG